MRDYYIEVLKRRIVGRGNVWFSSWATIHRRDRFSNVPHA
jgi:hypothetical protein